MTNPKLYAALEICLQALDHGADMQACLALFPELADELRPLLGAAFRARSVASPAVPADVSRRGKARVLQAAAEMREQAARSPRRWQNTFLGTRLFRLAASTSLVLAFLLTGGTGLVNASSSSLPGDHLYPVKRSWEGVRLLMVTNQTARLQLEQSFEQERVQEIEELYTANRVAQVNFQGKVESRDKGDWVVGGLQVNVGGNVQAVGEIAPGTMVQVVGETDNGVIKAEQIVLVATPSLVPAIQSSTDVPTNTATPALTNTPTVDEDDAGQTPTATGTGTNALPVLEATSTRHPSSNSGQNNSNNSASDDGSVGSAPDN